MITFKRNSDEEAILSAKYFPQGKGLVNLYNTESNLFKFIKGLSFEFTRITDLLNVLLKEFDIYSTENLIEEWENTVGIPDDCFSRNETLERRRLQVIAKIKADGVQSAEDLEEIISLLGFTAIVKAGADVHVWPVSFPWFFIGNTTESRFTIVVNFINATENTLFPVPFPWPFGGATVQTVQCFVQKLVPSNCKVVFTFDEEI